MRTHTLNIPGLNTRFIVTHRGSNGVVTRVIQLKDLMAFVKKRLGQAKTVQFVALLVDLPEDDYVWYDDFDMYGDEAVTFTVSPILSNNMFIK